MSHKIQWSGIDSGINYGGYLQHNVGFYLNQFDTDREAFEAAIAAITDGTEATIQIPFINRAYNLGAGYFDYGSRKITWYVDDGVSFGSESEWAKLNTKIITSKTIRGPGMHGVFDTGQTIRIGGGGALTNQTDSITGFDTLQQQAYRHERGLAGDYVSVGTGGIFRVSSASFTADSFIPATNISVNPLRVGMIVDVSGTTFYDGSVLTVRYTSKITGWEDDGSVIYVDGWYRHNGDMSETGIDAIQEIPPNGRAVTINPLNKLWIRAGDVFLNESEGDTYGHVSGSFHEYTVYNNTGQKLSTDFDQDTHPAHFYGYDGNIAGDYGGGNLFVARGEGVSWENALYVLAAENGLHMAANPNNNGGTAVLTSHDGVNGPDYAVKTRTYTSGSWRTNVLIDANQPIIELGREGLSSTPQLLFKSSGLSASHDAQIYGTGGSETNGQGDLVLAAAHVRMGNHTHIGSETITGFIEIKDSGGTLRKLAVVS